ncbi:unnamed protein product [Phaedon cochleariae]|uniref:Glycoside hydrolase family 38 N-terminal domain-containing protein n=1 Tax=Phaedon cochleariae TaxID=80249 RepID=A0A9N9X887_PHACE|nr:unnamed protein product [Phaedon cochleariae]
MTFSSRICRRITPKGFAITAVGLTIVLCVYYTNYVSDVNQRGNQSQRNDILDVGQSRRHFRSSFREQAARLVMEKKDLEICPKLTAAEADVNTNDVFKDFEFQPSWMKSKEYWDKVFEDRYERQKMDPEKPHLKVIIVPHSHNDPGWLKTFEHYFHYSSRQIMNNMVAKLQQYKNLTFIWSEVSFLNAWWEEAHPSKQRALRDLVQSGRLEITTGGWVMTDEANVHLYAMVDQLIEAINAQAAAFEPTVALSSLPINQPHPIENIRVVQTRFGEAIVVELEASSVFLPRRVVGIFKPQLPAFTPGKYSLIHKRSDTGPSLRLLKISGE